MVDLYRGYSEGLLADEEPTRFNDMYGTAATGLLFAPSAGISDIMGLAPDPARQGEYLPSFGANIREGNYLDAGLQALGGAGDVMMAGGALFPPAAAVGALMKAPRAIRVANRTDVSDLFGSGAESVTYSDPVSGGFIEVLQRKDGVPSVLQLEVPEQFRGSGIGQELQAAAMADNPTLQGQVSSKAAAVGAYRLGRRPVGNPSATLQDVFDIIDEQSSVNMAAPRAASVASRSAGGVTLGSMGGRGMIGHNNPPVVVGRTPYIVQNELRGTEFRTAELPDGSRTLIDAAGNPYIEEKTINKLLTGIPHTEMSSVVVPSERGLLVAPREVFPEQFEGQWMVNATGDRTRGGVRLIDVNGRPLYGDGTELMGGDEFMLYNQAPWASASSAITAIANQAKRIRQGVNPQNEAFDPDLGYDFDAPINLVTTNMAERSGDFAVDTAETLMRMMPTSEIKSKDLNAFDKEIKAKYPDYPSSKDPDKALEWIMKDAGTKGAGDRRKFYVATMAKGKYQGAGFPDIGSVRAAISRPETRFMPYGRTGGAISLLAPEGELPIVTRGADVAFPHKTYPDQVGSPNSYLGGYGITLGRNMAFPDSYAKLLGRGSEQAGIRRVFDTGREYQFMTPELVDTQMQFIEDQKAMLRNYGLLNDIY